MLPLRTWLDLWWAKIADFMEPDQSLIYLRCVLTAVDAPESARLLGKRSGASREAVLEQMRSGPYETFSVSQCGGPRKDAFDKALTDLAEIQDNTGQPCVRQSGTGGRPAC
ncbi:hypothetical protein [Streptomyces sp. NPDC102490]|uniref:hypothetical protein n=1 Tax=Streptomyces sp. NPDC102490 TaxID=3366183 RepID=UPI00381AC5F8